MELASVHLRFVGIWLDDSIPDFGRFLARAAPYMMEAALAEKPPSSLTLKRVHDGRFQVLKDRIVLYKNGRVRRVLTG